MEKPNPSSFAALLVERYGKDAYTRAVMLLMDNHRTGDRVGERFGLQLVMVVQQLLQASFPEDGLISCLLRSISLRSPFYGVDLPPFVNKPSITCQTQAETQTRVLH